MFLNQLWAEHTRLWWNENWLSWLLPEVGQEAHVMLHQMWDGHFWLIGCDKTKGVATSSAGTAACSTDLYLQLEQSSWPAFIFQPPLVSAACGDLGLTESAGAVSPEQDRLLVMLQLCCEDGLMSEHVPCSGTTSCCLLLLGHRSSFGKAAEEVWFTEMVSKNHCF